MVRHVPFAILIGFALSLLAPGLRAQDDELYRYPTEGVQLPAPSLTDTTDATSLEVNPANLALIDAWDFMYVGSWLDTQKEIAGHGHGLFFGAPLGPFAIGLSTEFMTPTNFIEDWQGLDSRVRFSLGLAFQIRRALAIGFTYRSLWYYKLDDLRTLDFGMTLRPSNLMALSFVVTNLNRPSATYAPTDDGNIPQFTEKVTRRLKLGLTLRPLGTDILAIGGELQYLSESFRRTDALALVSSNLWDRATLRVRFGAQGIDDGHDSAYFIDWNLVLNLPSFELGGGSYQKLSGGDDQGYLGVSWSIRFSGDERLGSLLPSSMRQKQVAVIKVEQRLGSHALTDFVALTERIERDPDLTAVLFKPDSGTIGFTAAQEIRRRIGAIQASGKQVYCYLTAATGSEYAACTKADEIWINPAGGIRLTGLSTQAVYFRALLDKIGVKADIVRIGEYKSAPEAYTQTGPTDPARAQLDRYLDVVYETLLRIIQEDRDFENTDAVREIIDQGPFSATTAQSAKLVDHIVPLTAIKDALSERYGETIAVNHHYGKHPLRHRRYVDAPAVAVIHIDGDLVDGESLNIPFLGINLTGAKTLSQLLTKVQRDPFVGAVLLRINSPGGSATAADIVWHKVMELRQHKPVIASMGSVAASGGYYIASAADEIYAEPTTLTGSIGIYYGKADTSGLLTKLGIDVTTFKRGNFADMESWTRSYTPEERQKLMALIGEFYNQFKDRVVQGRGRGFTAEIVENIGRGRIWAGVDAQEHLLVDTIGGYKEALDHTRRLAGAPIDVEVMQFPENGGKLLKRLIKSLGAQLGRESTLETLLRGQTISEPVKAAIPLLLSADSTPAARLPFAIIGH